MRIAGRKITVKTVLLYAIVITVTVVMLMPFAWMLSASLKLSRDVFAFPIEWIPSQPQWQNYVDIWTKIPLALFIYNTSKLTIIVTLLQLLTSEHRNLAVVGDVDDAPVAAGRGHRVLGEHGLVGPVEGANSEVDDARCDPVPVVAGAPNMSGEAVETGGREAQIGLLLGWKRGFFAICFDTELQQGQSLVNW